MRGGFPFATLLLVTVYAAVGVVAAYGTLVWQDLWGEEEDLNWVWWRGEAAAGWCADGSDTKEVRGCLLCGITKEEGTEGPEAGVAPHEPLQGPRKEPCSEPIQRH